jgi:hypothetical protein
MIGNSRVAPAERTLPQKLRDDAAFVAMIAKEVERLLCVPENRLRKITRAVTQRFQKSPGTQIKFLLEKISSHEPQTSDFNTTLKSALEKCNENNKLLELGIKYNVNNLDKLIKRSLFNVNLPFAKRNYPLHLAVAEKNVKLVKCLINAGANVNVLDEYGYTPLHDAVIHRRGAEYEEYNKSPGSITRESPEPKRTVSAIVKALLAAGASPLLGEGNNNAFVAAIIEHDLDSIRMFMKRLPNASEPKFETILRAIEAQYMVNIPFCKKLLNLFYKQDVFSIKLVNGILDAFHPDYTYDNINAYLRRKKSPVLSEIISNLNSDVLESSDESRATALKNRNDFIRKQNTYFLNKEVPAHIQTEDTLLKHTCSICFEERDDMTATTLDDFVITKCGHIFHKNCLQPWFINKEIEDRICPYCRAVVENIDDLIHFGGKKKSVKPRKPVQPRKPAKPRQAAKPRKPVQAAKPRKPRQRKP